jgi:hypothetical protein
MHASKSQKGHPQASTAGSGVLSVWLPNPGGTGMCSVIIDTTTLTLSTYLDSVIYIDDGPAAPSPSSSPLQDSSTPTPSRKHKRGMNPFPYSFNMSHSNDTKDPEIVELVGDAFKLLHTSVLLLLNSEHKSKLFDILQSLSELLSEVSNLLHHTIYG